MQLNSQQQRNPWTGTAFLVEALFLLLFLLASLAVFSSVLSRAIALSADQTRLDQAMVVAADSAEAFSASPATYVCEPLQDGLDVSCEVSPTELGGGTLYEATFTVSDGSDVIYTLSCARYVGGDDA